VLAARASVELPVWVGEGGAGWHRGGWCVGSTVAVRLWVGSAVEGSSRSEEDAAGN
jgi:hypothetical protein